MDTSQIERVLHQDPDASLIFTGVYARDQLPTTVKYPCSMVLNTDPVSKPGEHWVALYFDAEGRGEYFDSYGLPPPPVFKHFIQTFSARGWIQNDTQLQELWTSACGPFCVYYLLHRSQGIPMQNIVSVLKSMKNDDHYVTRYVNALL